MQIRDAIAAAVDGRDIEYDDMLEVMRRIMTGETTPAQIAGFLVALRMKGETVDEITAAATVMRDLSLKVDCDCAPLIDTCGTGGDSTGTFNISTAAAFVIAAAGGHVAKHGNRSVSSASGSADLLEAAGVNITLPPHEIARAVRETGFGFMFAQAHHSATRHAAGPRRELGIRTLFNVLGPLTNPAAAPLQVIGLFSVDWVRKIAAVLRRLGIRRALVVHAQDGLDELSIGAPTQIAELNAGEISHYVFDPTALGIAPAPLTALRVANAAESLAVIERVYANTPGPARDIVALNAGAALYLCELAPSIEAGYRQALALIANGAARAAFDRHIAFTRAIEVPDS